MTKENYHFYWKDYYQILQLHTSAEPEVIKAAYLKLVQKYNTDQNSPKFEQKWKDLNEAYEILGNPLKKTSYDREFSLREPKKHQVSPTSTAPPARPKPVVRPAIIRVSGVTPGEPRKAIFIISNEGAAYSKIRISKPNDWIKIPRLKSLSQSAKLPLEIELELTGDEWEKSYSDNIIVKLDEEETHIRIELTTIPEQPGTRQQGNRSTEEKPENKPRRDKPESSPTPPGPIIKTLTPNLRWKRIPGADYYNVWIEKRGKDAWEVVYGPQFAPFDAFTVPEKVLTPGGEYFWFAVAQGREIKNGPTSKVAYFRT